jgi:UDP-N-acetyl-D-glucosamine dehydrogenase
MATYSVSPAGERFPLPGPEDDAREIRRLEGLVAQARGEGKEEATSR